MSNEKSVRQVLVEARESLEKSFGTGCLYNEATGCLCSLGAIGYASGISLETLGNLPGSAWHLINPEAVAALTEGICEVTEYERDDSPVDFVWQFNDDCGKAPVLQAFDAAIAKLPE